MTGRVWSRVQFAAEAASVGRRLGSSDLLRVVSHVALNLVYEPSGLTVDTEVAP